MTSQPHETTVRAAIRGAVRKVLLSLLLGLAVNVLAQPQVSIAPYYEGRQAALSLTFDDGLLDQYTLAYPQLKARGLKATFAVIGSKVGGMVRSRQDRENGTEGTPCMTWQMLREMAADGQEIASHGIWPITDKKRKPKSRKSKSSPFRSFMRVSEDFTPKRHPRCLARQRGCLIR